MHEEAFRLPPPPDDAYVDLLCEENTIRSLKSTAEVLLQKRGINIKKFYPRKIKCQHNFLTLDSSISL
jgi:hypothetical protein